MNAKQIISAAVLATIGASAFAYEGNDFGYTSTLTRAEVKAELNQAIASKTLPVGGEVGYVADYVAPRTATSTVTRQDVRAQARDYVRSGLAYRDGNVAATVGN